MIHFVDETAEYHRIMNGPFIEYVRELKNSGKIRHIGMSTHNPQTAKLAALSGEIEMILFSINPAFDLLPASEDLNIMFADEYDASLNDMNPERAELYKLCEERSVGITVMKAYAGGRLFDASRSPFGTALTPVQCLHYCLTRPAVSSIMVGFDTADQVLDAVHYETATEEEKDYATVLANAPKHAFAGGQCTYCGHCKPCPAGIDIAMVNKLYDLAVMQPEVPASVRAHYEQLNIHADACIHCRGCEKRCPFGVSISDRMEKTAKLFAR